MCIVCHFLWRSLFHQQRLALVSVGHPLHLDSPGEFHLLAHLAQDDVLQTLPAYQRVDFEECFRGQVLCGARSGRHHGHCADQRRKTAAKGEINGRNRDVRVWFWLSKGAREVSQPKVVSRGYQWRNGGRRWGWKRLVWRKDQTVQPEQWPKILKCIWLILEETQQAHLSNSYLPLGW